MRVLVVGGGGREHALAWKLARGPSVDRLFAAPGNPGIAEIAKCVPVGATDTGRIVDLARRERIDLTVVGPEVPLVAGLVDALAERGLAAFGPSAAGARLEGSKSWAKELCLSLGIPTARSGTFTDVPSAERFLDELEPPYVVKADGLAAGKGVVIAASRAEAVAALNACLVEGSFGPAGETVLLEEHLVGREVSMHALTDGETVLPLEAAQDFKRVGDGDRGPNTGGMGAYSPVPFVDTDVGKRIREEVLHPVASGLADRGIDYRGVIYAGLMLTADGPRVLEFNCRFGDPETQALLPRLDDDLGELLMATATGGLRDRRAAWAEDACVTVVLASGGYPGEHEEGLPIAGLDEAAKFDKVAVFHAGTALRDDRVVTAGGRVLAVSALGKDLADARERANRAAAAISFAGMHRRSDIAEEAARG